jgi:hypothetical protein
VGLLKILFKPLEMTKFIALIALFTLQIAFHQAAATDTLTPFTSQPPLSSALTKINHAKIVSFKGTLEKQKLILNWVVADNKMADKFEVEKSFDGKNFSMAAVVFGTDKDANDYYQFYEKAGKRKMLYRIKIINKNLQTEFSAIIEINPIN